MVQFCYLLFEYTETDATVTPASPATSPAPSVVKEVQIEDEAGYSPEVEYARQKVLAAPAVRRLAHDNKVSSFETFNVFFIIETMEQGTKGIS